MDTLVHFTISSFTENAELRVLTQSSLTELNKRGWLNNLQNFHVTVLGKRVTSHTSVALCLICLFQILAEGLVWALPSNYHFLGWALLLLSSVLLNGRLLLVLYETLLGEWLLRISLLKSKLLKFLRISLSHANINKALTYRAVGTLIISLQSCDWHLLCVMGLFWSFSLCKASLNFYEATAFSHSCWKF
jgi:hypothetical protein